MAPVADEARQLVRIWESDIKGCKVCGNLSVDSPNRCEVCKATAVHISQLQAMLAQQGEPVR